MKYSKQRNIILKMLMEYPMHPTAEQLYMLIKQTEPRISLATVYRNLNQLADNGVIKKIDGLGGVSHFDHNTYEHYHFICQKCNKVYDIPYEVIPSFANEITAKTGLNVEVCNVAIGGTCTACQKKN